MQIESEAWAFQQAINQGRVSRQLPQNGIQMPKFIVFQGNFNQKPLKVCYKVSLSKNF